MKKISKKLLTTVVLLVIGQLALATDPPTSQTILNTIQGEKNTWFEIINLVIEIILFAGVIYIVISMLSKQQTNKNILVGWVIALIAWAFANVLLN